MLLEYGSKNKEIKNIAKLRRKKIINNNVHNQMLTWNLHFFMPELTKYLKLNL